MGLFLGGGGGYEATMGVVEWMVCLYMCGHVHMSRTLSHVYITHTPKHTYTQTPKHTPNTHIHPPQVKLIREGIDDTSAFEDWLVEDAHHPTHTHTNTTQHHQQQEDDIHGGAFSLLLFLGKIRSEAESYIRDFPGHRAAAAVVAAQSPRHQPRAHGGVYGTPPSRGHRNGGEGGVYSPAHVLQG